MNHPAPLAELGLSRISLTRSILLGMVCGCLLGLWGGGANRAVVVPVTIVAGGLLSASGWVLVAICIRFVHERGFRHWWTASLTTFLVIAGLGLIHPLIATPGDWAAWGRWLVPGLLLAPLVAAVNGVLGRPLKPHPPC